MSQFEIQHKVLLLVGTGLVTLAVLAGALTSLARRADLDLKSNAEAVVQNGLIALGAELESQVVPNAVWDEAVKNLDNEFDANWAHDNVGVFFKATMKTAFSLVIDASDKPVYAMIDDSDTDLARAEHLWRNCTTIVERIRTKEKQWRGKSAPSLAETLREPVQASSFIESDGRIFFVSATLVQSDFGKRRILAANAPMIVTGRELNASLLEQIRNRYNLSDLAMDRGEPAFDTERAHAVIADDAGKAIAVIHWNARLPGMALLGSTLPWAVALTLCLFSGSIYFYVRSQNAETELVGSQNRAIHLTYHDGLTGLHNRAFLELAAPDFFSNARAVGARLAFHSIDLDQFKVINDLHGHAVGDELLKEAANRCRSECSASDICVRTSGDGFGILQLIGVDKNAPSLVARLQSRLQQPYRLSIGSRAVSTSIGSATSADGEAEPLELFRRADVALRFAKVAGGGSAQVYDAEIDQDLRDKNVLLEELRKDIASGRLGMVYQPQFDDCGTMIGVEALVRWSRASEGPISPEIFVALAEDAGLISQLGELTIGMALADSKMWPDLKTAINVSATQLRTEDFALQMLEMIVSANVDPSRIEIELTEGVLLTELEVVKSNLAGLRAAGLSIALDDFGTGYSSLSYLSRFPVDKLKIDRSFVVSLGKSERAHALVKAIILLAKALQVRVIAEGVETDEQWFSLCEAGCTEFQGYLTGRPLPAVQLLAARSAGTGSGGRTMAEGL